MSTGKLRRVMVSALVAVTTAIASFVLIAGVGLELIMLSVTSGHPNDPSAGDSAGWGAIILAPVVLGAAFFVGISLGVFAFILCRKKLAPRHDVDAEITR